MKPTHSPTGRGLLFSLAAWLAGRMPDRLRQGLYSLGPVSGWIRRALNRAVPQGLTEVTVAAGALAGARLRLDLQVEKDYWLGTYEPDLQQAIQSLARPGMVAYDLGANVGYITLLLARAVGDDGQVYAFEALPENLNRLQANLKLNGLQERVQVVAGAVTDRPVPVRFLVGPSGGTGKAEGSAGRQWPYTRSISVKGVRLDDFVYQTGQPPPDLVKMDIEGGEGPALAGMGRLLEQVRPILLLELHGPESAQAAWTTLSAAGYRLHRMAPGYPPIDSLGTLDWKAYLLARPEAPS